jgi:EmrB/QacA subfamily drug resistance transporter
MRKYIIFGTVCLGLLLTSTSNSMASVALSTLITDLDTTLVLAGWVLSGFSLVHTVVMPLAGKISDMLGRKRTFIAYTVLFTAGSVLCAISSNIYFLIGARIIQALGGAGIMPCASGIVSDEFPEDWPRYIGLFSSVFPIGMIIGPNIGGWLVEVFGWRYMFWFNVPFGAVVLLTSIFLLPKRENKNTQMSIDFAGTGLLFGSIFSLMLGLTQLGTKEEEMPWVIVGVLFALAIGLFILFLRWERRVKSPIIDFELLGSRPFLAANVYNLLYGIGGLGVLSLIPLYAVSVYNMSVLESGILLTPRSIGMIVASSVISFGMTRWGYFRPIMGGTLLLILGLFLLSLQSPGFEFLGMRIDGVVMLFIVVGICGLGAGIATPASSNACIELMPDKVATITGLRGMFRSLGSAMGVSLATIALNNIEDVRQAWYVVYVGAVVITLLAVPAIFGMPASAKVGTPKEQASN